MPVLTVAVSLSAAFPRIHLPGRTAPSLAPGLKETVSDALVTGWEKSMPSRCGSHALRGWILPARDSFVILT